MQFNNFINRYLRQLINLFSKKNKGKILPPLSDDTKEWERLHTFWTAKKIKQKDYISHFCQRKRLIKRQNLYKYLIMEDLTFGVGGGGKIL